MDRRLLLIVVAVLVIAGLLFAVRSTAPPPERVPAEVAVVSTIDPATAPDDDAGLAVADDPAMRGATDPNGPSPAHPTEAIDTSHIQLPPPWPELAREDELVDGIWASEDIDASIAALQPYADAGDLPSLFAIHMGLESCGMLRFIGRAETYEEIEAQFLTDEGTRELPPGYDLDQLYACHAVLRSDYQARIDATTAALLEARHPAVVVTRAYSEACEERAGWCGQALRDVREALRSGHPGPLSSVGHTLAMRGVMADMVGADISPMDVRTAVQDAMNSDRTRAWNLLHCIQGQRGGADYPYCDAMASGSDSPAEVLRHAEEIAAAIMAEDWGALGLGDLEDGP